MKPITGKPDQPVLTRSLRGMEWPPVIFGWSVSSCYYVVGKKDRMRRLMYLLIVLKRILILRLFLLHNMVQSSEPNLCTIVGSAVHASKIHQ